MKAYNHDLANVCEACGVSEDTMTELRKTVILNFIKDSKSASEVVEKVEKIILKDVENYLRPFVLDYITTHMSSLALIHSKMPLSGLRETLQRLEEELEKEIG
jgi:hypothetical protein